VRSTFIIDREGMLIHAMYGVTARGHAADVLKLIKGLSKCR
jgi:thioredoxin-dependent peroxiredoxin